LKIDSKAASSVRLMCFWHFLSSLPSFCKQHQNVAEFTTPYAHVQHLKLLPHADQLQTSSRQSLQSTFLSVSLYFSDLLDNTCSAA
jgi:hypothetical protein